MPLRLRLAAGNAVVLAAGIVLLSSVAYAQLGRSLFDAVNESLRSQAQNLARVYEARASLPPRARERIAPQPSVFSSPSFLVQVLDPDGNIVERSSALGNRRLPVNPESLRQAGEENEEVYETVTLEGLHVRLYTTAFFSEDEFQGYIQVAQSLEGAEDALEFLRSTLLGAGAALLILSLVVAWFLAGASLRPVAQVTRAAQDIARSGRLDQRLDPPSTHDEVARLVETFNRMMDRLEHAFAAQRRFVADASHELRTPLTTIRGNIEILRRSRAGGSADMNEALDDVIAESDRMSRLLAGLLALERADAGQPIAHVPVQLDELAQKVQREIQPVAGDVSVELDTVESVETLGDPDALKQLLLILVDNGVKYAPAGTVTLSVKRNGKKTLLSVRDTGPGIAKEDLPHIFDRFYRSPASRATGGTGLGLAIARWIAEAHEGHIHVETAPHAGTTFTVELPAVPQDPRHAAGTEDSYPSLSLPSRGS